MLWGYVYKVTASATDADDIVQEAFLRLLRAGPKESDDEHRRRFLYRAASNLVVDRWRRQTRSERIGRQSDASVVSPDEGSSDVARTFAELTRRDRSLLWLAYVEEASHEEIATSLKGGTCEREGVALQG